MSNSDPALLAKVTKLAAGYFGAAKVRPDDVPRVIAIMAKTLTTLSCETFTGGAAPAVAKATPVQIRRSIKPEALVSFEDGKSYKMLKRHLIKVGLTPDQYRAKWGLPKDYPMVPVAYSATRFGFASSNSPGQKRTAMLRAKSAPGQTEKF